MWTMNGTARFRPVGYPTKKVMRHYIQLFKLKKISRKKLSENSRSSRNIFGRLDLKNN